PRPADRRSRSAPPRRSRGSRSCRRDATRAPRPSQGAEPHCAAGSPARRNAPPRYSLQVRSTGQAPLHSVEMLAGSGPHWSTPPPDGVPVGPIQIGHLVQELGGAAHARVVAAPAGRLLDARVGLPREEAAAVGVIDARRADPTLVTVAHGAARAAGGRVAPRLDARCAVVAEAPATAGTLGVTATRRRREVGAASDRALPREQVAQLGWRPAALRVVTAERAAQRLGRRRA